MVVRGLINISPAHSGVGIFSESDGWAVVIGLKLWLLEG